MNLAVDNFIVSDPIAAILANEENFRRWIEHPSSVILHHDNACCDEAKLWFLAYAKSMEMGALSQFSLKPPVWLSDLFSWGPSVWPIFWCQVVQEKTLDCGAFAALAREVFKAQGHEVHAAQVLLKYNQTCTHHWKDLWESAEIFKDKKRMKETFPWIGNDVVYHEICVIETPDGEAKVYDSTWGLWYEPHARSGFGSLLALRTECPRQLRWGDKTMICGEWTLL